MKGVSVIVCCYNSSKRIPETIRHLCMSKVPDDIPWEVVIIDNCSTDDTSEVALLEWNKYTVYNAGFKVVKEPVPGLSAARERGIRETRFEYIIFCDDDNWLHDEYLHRAFNLMENKKDVAVLGGCGTPVCEIEPPAWFEDYKGYYATGPQGKTSGDITYAKGYAYGAGSAYRRSALQDLFNKGFSSLLDDRKGNSMSSGGDVELCKALKLSGYRIWYDGSLTFRHFIPANRLTWQYVQKMHNGYLVSQSVLTAYAYIERKKDAFWIVWIKDVLYRTVKWLKTAFRYGQFKKQGKLNMFRLTLRYQLNCITGLLIKVNAIRNNQVFIKRSEWFDNSK